MCVPVPGDSALGQASDVSGTQMKAGIQGGEGIIGGRLSLGAGQQPQATQEGKGTGEERRKPGTRQRCRDRQNLWERGLGPEAKCQVEAFKTESFTFWTVFLERD